VEERKVEALETEERHKRVQAGRLTLEEIKQFVSTGMTHDEVVSKIGAPYAKEDFTNGQVQWYRSLHRSGSYTVDLALTYDGSKRLVSITETTENYYRERQRKLRGR
jgi:outer membrane protein assembly factor BamE (lipoprotein component of BamABCDE complex)